MFLFPSVRLEGGTLGAKEDGDAHFYTFFWPAPSLFCPPPPFVDVENFS